MRMGGRKSRFFEVWMPWGTYKGTQAKSCLGCKVESVLSGLEAENVTKD